ncbi:CAMKK/CAMKK-META protein kinase [Spizellomyces punctatus DAOM BR117]|uniref:CAMKK/CAMKK-META protein kinase n=1 Tax=Spizellomyces punctatus (strain DAOM BR117) TaxID=645134 RepID=A0A0L0HCH8_SPIPD|nr:CAMKK/CAMKK-META protein kinase [Spizellomyces punctatus DAOM BR117]KNC98646.1 CAMKK/CAMKK-META protein kinase [Spizellomyces punctatus DAOM BR117]|eukprot:XP_016606686.1 CAMKK/CAMKK-META protein kinase [Spizellomyces punctatus DAOM BR117]
MSSLNVPEDTLSTLGPPRSPSRASRRASADAGIKETLNAVFREESDGQRTLNQYIIKDVLGKGAYGTVYYGVDTSAEGQNEGVAIKEFSKSKLRRQKLQREGGPFGARGLRGRGRGAGVAPSALSHANMLAKSDNPIDLVRGEIAILKKLDHENVVRLYEVLDDPQQDSLYMVFELCSKGPIMDISLDKPTAPLPEDLARDYFRQMILGIEYLHEHDIAHRDIKPDNMLVAADGTLKIVDFGVSEIFSPASDRLKTSAGSPAFSAPEVCVAHHGDFSARACDIWAMGVTLYCMLFGSLPFNGTSIIDLYESIRSAPTPYPDSASALQRNVLERLLEKNPTQRISMDELRVHPWVTKNGTAPLRSRSENCVPVSDITEEDIKTAVKGIIPLFTVLKAVNKLKKLRQSAEVDSKG